MQKIVVEAKTEFDVPLLVQRYYRTGSSQKRPCRICVHSHYKKGSQDNNCDAIDCMFIPKQGWTEWLSRNVNIKLIKPEIKNEEEIEWIKDLITHYQKKGYLSESEAELLAEVYNITGISPFKQEIGIKYLAHGLKKQGHFPHAISHRLVDRLALEHIFNELNGKNLLI